MGRIVEPVTPRVASIPVRVPLEYGFERLAEDAGDAKGDLERGRIFALLDRRDRLAGHANPVAEFALRHFAGEEAQRADVVGEGRCRHESAPDLSASYA